METLIGFRRNLEGINSTDFGVKSKAERQSVNTVIQGTGASLTNTALYLITEYLRVNKLRSKLAITVHDSVLIDCPPEELPKVPEDILTIMTNLPFKWLFTNYKGKTIRYPIDAEMEIGVTYNDMVEYVPEEVKDFPSLDSYIKYNLALTKVADYEESGKITKEEFKVLTKKIEENHP